jgi:hypothetical protein
MNVLRLSAIIIFCLVFGSHVAYAGDEQITLNPDGSHSNQNQINEALKNGNVYLNAGIYEVDNTIIIGSDRVLSGDSNAIIRVYSGSSQWFTGATGVISCSGIVDNVEISGFQIDGNIGSLPKSYANSRADTDHDCEKLIILRGSSTQFAKNIKIHNLKLYNSFSDGIYIIFGENIQCYDNFISNCQHEGIYYSCLKNSEFFRNKIAGICSDAARLDNCVNCKVHDNYFFSYNGESYGQYKGGQAGLQIANAGSSHGYDASKKPQKTDNVEVYNNVFADPGRQAIWLHNYDGNVYVHDNSFIDAASLETQGIPVGDISVDNPPTVETSEKVFTNIIDFLKQDYIFQYPAVKHDFKASATVTSLNSSIKQSSTVRVSGKHLSVVKFEYKGITTKHFIERNMWVGELSHIGNDLYIPGQIQSEKLHITVYGKAGFQKVENFKITEVSSAGVSINPNFFIFIAVLAICGLSIARNLRRIF